MATASKQKGNAFERKIAKTFSDKFSERFNGKESFRRSVTSGASFGGSNSINAETMLEEHQIDIGDIMTPRQFKFTIECKHYKTPVSINGLFSNDKKLDEWIEQSVLQAKLAKKDFLLIIKWNDVKEIVITPVKVESIENYHYYNKYYIYRLEDLLKLPDSFFF